MSINDGLIDVVILGAGAPSIGEVPSPLKQISRRNSVIEWQLNCFKGIKNINNIYFIGGYKINDIVKANFTISNLFNHKHTEIVGGPSIGRVALLRLTTTF